MEHKWWSSHSMEYYAAPKIEAPELNLKHAFSTRKQDTKFYL